MRFKNRWLGKLTAAVWTKMHREYEVRRMRRSWATIDNQTLRDIGISRLEIEFAGDIRYWRARYRADDASRPAGRLNSRLPAGTFISRAS
ncbi:MAG TPA: DUF1127 domain-containing protein [Stellaceae bacterium]|nr:DUF1127 domain-containing protein [Stellaceae bacterium]